MASRLLYTELRQESASLADDLDAISKEALVLWQSEHLRMFTAHGKDHILQVETNLDSLTRGLQNSPQKLQPHETFVLIAACYLHDIGMQLGERDARQKHAQYAFQMILNSYARDRAMERRVQLPINDRNSRQAIAAVARGHWTNYAIQMDSEDTIVDNKRGRLRLLGLLLATADLLDLSPVRATYFRTVHELDKLDATAELHHTLHHLVKGCEISAPDSKIPEEVQFQLAWADDSDVTRMISEWILHRFHLQWRAVASVMYRESQGRIRWAKPWVVTSFRAPVGPPATLSDRGRNTLCAERAEQRRINRDRVVREFRDAVRHRRRAVFRFPSNSEMDAKPLVDWCESHARLVRKTRVARVDIQPTAALDHSSIVAQILEQWGEHLQQCSNRIAVQRLRAHASGQGSEALVTIIVVGGAYQLTSLNSIVEAAMMRPNSKVARVVFLLTPEAAGPKVIGGSKVVVHNAGSFSKADIVNHLQQQWGLSRVEGEETYFKMRQIEITRDPARVYDYIRDHCGTSGACV
jgi:hypothetical protein